MKNLLAYNGYHAQIELDTENDLLWGTVIGINDSLTFQGKDVMELKEMFKQSIDNYLEMCKTFGKEPDKEYKGSFNVRISPDLHKSADFEARKREQSLNQFVSSAIENEISGRKEIVKETIYVCAPMEIVKNTIYNKMNSADYTVFESKTRGLNYSAGIQNN